MVVLKGLSCSANILRGQLKHSWLEHKVRDKSPDDRVKRWADQNTDKEINIIFPFRIEQSRELARTMDDGFSPAQLVDLLGPFQTLPAGTRTSLKEAVHAVYLETTEISTLAETLAQKIEDFAEEFENFRTIWNFEHTPENELLLRRAWSQVQEKGIALLKIFEKLPEGVMLP